LDIAVPVSIGSSQELVGKTGINLQGGRTVIAFRSDWREGAVVSVIRIPKFGATI
jgi:hypothetical protein